MKKITILFLLSILIGGLSNVFGQVNLDSGLVGYWPFNGNANDFSGNNYNGTILNGVLPTTGHTSQANTACYFDGVDDFIDLDLYCGFPNVNWQVDDISVSVWIKTNTANSIRTIISDNSNSGYWYLHVDSIGKFRLGMRYSNWGGTDIISNGTINDNNFHHLVAIMQGDVFKLLK